MFKDDFIEFITNKLNELNQNDFDYTIRISDEIDFDYEKENDISINIIFGASSKIEGATDSQVINFVLDAFGEHGDGNYTNFLLQKLFEDLGHSSNLVGKYQTFMILSSPQVSSTFVESQASFRNRYSLSGQIIYTKTNLINPKYKVSFDDETEEYEIETITPEFSRNNNIDTKVDNVGIIPISQGIVSSGSFSFILKNNEFSKKIIDYMFSKIDIDHINLSILYNENLAYKLVNLKISNVISKFDEGTRSTIITLTWVGDDNA